MIFKAASSPTGEAAQSGDGQTQLEGAEQNSPNTSQRVRSVRRKCNLQPTSKTPLVSIVIPAYNRRDATLALLRDVVSQTYTPVEILVVDDCSPDDTASAVATTFPMVRVFRNEKNGGPAVSRNRGIREAAGEFVVGFDSDVTVPDRNLVAKVVQEFTAHPSTTGMAFRLLSPDGKSDDVPRWWHPVSIAGFADRKFLTDYFSGTGYAFRRQAVLAAGLFPEVFYMHYEEVLLAYRILDAGGQIVHTPDIPVVHHASPVAKRSKIKMFYKPRNQLLLAFSCLPWARGLAYTVPRIGYNFLQSIRGLYLGEFLRAMWSALALAPTVLRGRIVLSPATLHSLRRLRSGVAPH